MRPSCSNTIGNATIWCTPSLQRYYWDAVWLVPSRNFQESALCKAQHLQISCRIGWTCWPGKIWVNKTWFIWDASKFRIRCPNTLGWRNIYYACGSASGDAEMHHIVVKGQMVDLITRLSCHTLQKPKISHSCPFMFRLVISRQTHMNILACHKSNWVLRVSCTMAPDYGRRACWKI